MQLRLLGFYILAVAFAVTVCQPVSRLKATSQLANNDAREVASASLWWIGETPPFDDLKDRPAESCREQTGDVVADFRRNGLLHRLTNSSPGLTKVCKVYALHHVYLI